MRRWTEKEIVLLKLHYENEVSWTRLKNLFPGRSMNSIKIKAKELKLNRSKFNGRKGFYYIFANCPICGRILKNKVKWEGKGLSIPKCSICGSRVKILPKSSELRRKYRNG